MKTKLTVKIETTDEMVAAMRQPRQETSAMTPLEFVVVIDGVRYPVKFNTSAVRYGLPAAIHPTMDGKNLRADPGDIATLLTADPGSAGFKTIFAAWREALEAANKDAIVSVIKIYPRGRVESYSLTIGEILLRGSLPIAYAEILLPGESPEAGIKRTGKQKVVSLEVV